MLFGACGSRCLLDGNLAALILALFLSSFTAIFHCDQKDSQFLTKFFSCPSAWGQDSGTLPWSLFVLCVQEQGDLVFLASALRYLKELISL